MRCHQETAAKLRRRCVKKLDMSSGTSGNTSTGDRAAASSLTSPEAAAGCGSITAKERIRTADSRLYRLVAPKPKVEIQESNLRPYEYQSYALTV